jgi:coniferyl-aldehyde dehydrogenase
MGAKQLQGSSEMNNITNVASSENLSHIDQVFAKQRMASRQDPYPSLEARLQNLDKLQKILHENQAAITDAINTDFGCRSHQETRMLEIFGLLGGIAYNRKRLKKWMKPQKRHVGMAYLGAKNTVIPQPKGVVGVVAPWNYPLFLAFSPCISALAAGNRCIVKMASNSQTLCRLMDKLVSAVFDEDTLAIMPGVSANDFTHRPWDHLVFTGSPAVGKIVMATAAKYLTPVTLELGGKSPTIIADDCDLKMAAERLLFGKFLNAGQTCVAPDYLFIPREKVATFVELAKEIVSKRYPTSASQDFTSVIDDKAFARLTAVLQDAIDKGAEPINLLGTENSNSETRKIPPHLVLNPSDEMQIMQDEIFGPLLPIKPYDDLDEVIEYINGNERPLALYLFSNDTASQDKVIHNTLSGGMCLNDSMLHVGQHDMPFGGVGNSGMGHYHGKEGFIEFSKLRPIFKQAKKSAILALAPPYGGAFEKMAKLTMKWKLY